MRRNILTILQSNQFDLKTEYSRLLDLFYEPFDGEISISELVDKYFNTSQFSSWKAISPKYKTIPITNNKIFNNASLSAEVNNI